MDESTARSCHPDSMRQAFLWALLPSLVLFLIAPAVGDAQVTVTTSITHTPGAGDLGTTVTHTGNLYDITGGTRPGSGPNLFHSFGDLSVGGGDIANFLNNTGLQTSNIIGRVTGGNSSNIDGTIQTTGFGTANLFLVNPSGFVFGPHGSVNVTGSVGFTTAQYLRLFDGVNSANFYANPANDGLANSVLAVAPVVDFGFLSPAAYGFLTAPDPSATITVQGSALSVLSGQSISLVGGKVVIQGATLPDGTVQPARLSAPNGNILLASAATPGEFDVATLQPLPNNVDGVSGVSFSSFGSVSLTSGSDINVSGANTVFVKGGQLVLSVNDAVLSTSQTPGPPGTISLSPGSSITTSNSGGDPGAAVQITVENLSLDGSAITTENLGDGIGGNITANVGTLSLANGASINSNNSSFRIGDDGNFIIGIGLGGNLRIQGRTGADSVADKVMLSNGSMITTQTFSSKPGGDLVIAAEDVHLDASTISTTTFGPGRGGDVHITADSLTLENGATMTTETSFLGEVGGDLFLNVGTLRLMGGESGGSLIHSLNGPGADLDGDGVIDVIGKGNGGNITIQGTGQGANSAADLVVLSGSSGITSGALSGSGGGGQISIRATSLDLKEASVITSSTSAFGTDLDGDGVLDDLTNGGGNILVAVQNLRVVDGSTISSSTNLSETLAVAGGMVKVEGLEGSKPGSVLLSGQNSGIFSNSAAGVPGDITVNTGTLTITNGAVINTGSAESGPAGSVGVTANSVVISAGGQIFSQSAAQNAGQVTITANELMLDNGSIVTRTFSEHLGRGGDVVLNGGTVSLTNGASINSQSEIFSNGQAGNIKMNNLESLTLANHSEITSSSQGIVANAGDAGTITITTTGNVVSLASGSSITSSTVGPGNAGQVIVTTPALNMDNATITTSTSGTGNAGGITAAVGTLTLTNAAEISSSSTGVATGDAGSVTIQGLASPADSVTLMNSSLLTSAESTGRGGNITVNTTNLVLTNATISASVKDVDATDGPTSGLGNIALISSTMNMTGGTVTAATSGMRNAGQILIASPVLSLNNGTLTTSTSGTGDAGGITAAVGTLTLTNAAEISSSSTGVATGDAGSVTIQGLVSPANAVTITNSSLLTKAEGSGQGGDISVSGLTVTLNNATISATSNAGNAGSVTIKDANTVQSTNGSVTTESTTGAGGSITIDAVNSINLSGTTISAKVTGGTEDGGNITVSAGQQVTMENGTVVSAQSLSTDEKAGDAGTVTVKAGNQFLMNNSSITTESTKAGGGRVEINVADGFMVQLINSGIKTSVFGGSDTKGGNINIDPQFVVLQNSQILAQAFAGAGGAITITAASAFIADPLSIVDASSTKGISGTVNIQSPLQNVGGELTALTQQFSSAAALLAQQCAARAADGKFSTFVVAAREGLPAEPGGFLASPSLTAELLGSRLSGRDPQTQLSAVTGLFPKYDARPIQLAMFGNACHRQ